MSKTPDNPGFEPWSPAEMAYHASEHERGLRTVEMLGRKPTKIAPGLREALSRAWDESVAKDEHRALIRAERTRAERRAERVGAYRQPWARGYRRRLWQAGMAS